MKLSPEDYAIAFKERAKICKKIGVDPNSRMGPVFAKLFDQACDRARNLESTTASMLYPCEIVHLPWWKASAAGMIEDEQKAA